MGGSYSFCQNVKHIVNSVQIYYFINQQPQQCLNTSLQNSFEQLLLQSILIAPITGFTKLYLDLKLPKETRNTI